VFPSCSDCFLYISCYTCCNYVPIKHSRNMIPYIVGYHLLSLNNTNGGTAEDVKARIQKATVAFVMFRNIWKANHIQINTKLRIFDSNVKAGLPYGSATWRSTQKTLKIIQTFINKCLRRILHLKWTDKVPNTTLWKMTKQLPIENEIKKRKWRWIGHTLSKPPETITRQAITWNPPGKRRRVRPRNIWQRDTEKRNKGDGIHQERNGEDGH